jgi:nucleoside-diphosphate-sugar epimerase
LGGSEEHNILELANLIKKLIGSNSEIIFHPLPQNDPKQRRPDITLAKELLSWEPQTPLQEGLKRTIAYFREELENCGRLGK